MFAPAQPGCCPACAKTTEQSASIRQPLSEAFAAPTEGGVATDSGKMQADSVARGDTSTAFKAIDMFNGAPSAVIDAAMASARLQSFDRDARIFTQGDRATHAFAVLEGSVRVIQTGCDGGQIICCFAASGESFGAAAVFNAERLSADAMAAQPSLLASWNKAQLLALIGACPRIAVNIIGSVGRCLSESHNRVRELATQRSDQRIAHTLLRLAGQAGLDLDGNRAITIPLRRRDVADAAGTTLHTASRALAGWEKCGLLETREQQLMIRDMPALTRIAHGLDA